ncbi:MAG: acetyltransferase [Roseiarcus sp.]
MARALFGLIGAGGFGREVIPYARAQLADQIAAGDAELAFVVEGPKPAPAVDGTSVLTMEEFRDWRGERFFNVAIAASQPRMRIVDFCITEGMRPFSIRCQNAVVSDTCEIGEGAILCAFVTITANAKIGRFFHANIYSYVAHDCIIGDFVTLAPRVSCNGNVHIEDHAYVGTGAVIREGSPGRPTIISRRAIIGMGAVVTRSVEQGCTVVGNPARPIGEKRT